MASPSADLSAAAAVPLAHALCAFLGRTADIRVFSIKGPVVEFHGLREPHRSADADIWVEHSRFHEMVALLQQRGWKKRRGEAQDSVALPSATLFHPQWPIDIDLHYSFRGMFGDPAEIFATFWRDRIEFEVAGRPVWGTNWAASALIGLIHSEKAPEAYRSHRETKMILAALAKAPILQREQFAQYIGLTRTGFVLQQVVTDVRLLRNPDDLTAAEQRAWTFYQQSQPGGDTISVVWQAEQQRGWGRWRAYLRALWLPRAQIPSYPPDRVVGRVEAMTYRWRRWCVLWRSRRERWEKLRASQRAAR